MRRRFADHTASVLVSSLGAAFGVTLLEVTGVLSQVIEADSATGSKASVDVVLGVVAVVFIVIALYVSAIVIANTFSIIIAGRTRTIALRRLIGASAGSERRAVAREGLLVGVIGAVIGAAVGTGVTFALVGVGMAVGTIPSGNYTVIGPVIALPIGAVVVTTWLASWVGSRQVLQVSPIEAIGVAIEKSREQSAGRRGRNLAAGVFFGIGIVVLVAGMLVGLVSPSGILIAVLGGIASFSGVVLGAAAVIPVALRLIGRLFGSSATARLGAENAVRYPERSARSTIGLIIGVTLVSMFAVAVETFQAIINSAQHQSPGSYVGTNSVLLVVVVVFSILMGFSALIAAVGMVNSLSMSVLQRTRELGLLRALGFTARQVRLMIVAESAQLTIAAVVIGLVLGSFYGWAGAQSLLGSITGSPGIVAPVVPLPLLAALAVAAAILTLAASVAPARRATTIAPIEALAAE